MLTLFPRPPFLYNIGEAASKGQLEGIMPSLRDFLTFERYLTPSIIRVLYLLAAALILIFGIVNILAAFAAMAYSLFTGVAWLICAIVGTAVGLLAVRVLAEIVLVLFQNNEHLAALRTHVEGR